MQLVPGKQGDDVAENKNDVIDEHVHSDEHVDSLLDRSFMEKFLQRRSLRLRNMQRAWQVVFCYSCFVWHITFEGFFEQL